MSSVITEAERMAGPFPHVLFGESDGATRIFMIHGAFTAQSHAGLHRHDGDKIWRIRRGRIRITVDGQQAECAAGQLVVIPPNVLHGVVGLDDDIEAEVIDEMAMGEWVAIIDPDGSRREIEAHVPNIPWHRPPPEGVPPTAVEDFLAMLDSTAHLL